MDNHLYKKVKSPSLDYDNIKVTMAEVFVFLRDNLSREIEARLVIPEPCLNDVLMGCWLAYDWVLVHDHEDPWEMVTSATKAKSVPSAYIEVQALPYGTQQVSLYVLDPDVVRGEDSYRFEPTINLEVIFDGFVDHWKARINHPNRLLLAGGKTRNRKPSPEILDICREAMSYWLDDNKSLQTAAELAGVNKRTVRQWIPNVLIMIDETTQEKWTRMLKALGELNTS